jgi:hypothetical protein
MIPCSIARIFDAMINVYINADRTSGMYGDSGAGTSGAGITDASSSAIVASVCCWGRLRLYRPAIAMSRFDLVKQNKQTRLLARRSPVGELLTPLKQP